MTLKINILNFFRNFLKFKVCEKYLKKYTHDKQSTDFICKFVPNNYQYKPGSYRIFKYNNIYLKADISDYVGHYLYFGYKDISHTKLFDLVNKNDTVLDIGTNIGSTILQFANIIGKNGMTYGFEPDPFNYNECSENIKLNSFNNIRVDKIGLGDKEGEFKLYVDTVTNRGGNRIKLDNDSVKEYSLIKVLTLDDWFKVNEINNVDLIKIDVEGFEMNVLRGGEQVIERFRPKLFIELDENNLTDIGSSSFELISFLEEKGYNITNANTNKVVLSNDNFNNCHFDIIAIYKK